MNPDDAWKRFEEPGEDYWPIEKAAILSELAKYFEEQGAADRLDDMRKEWTLLNRCGLVPVDSSPDLWQWRIDNIGRPYPEWRLPTWLTTKRG